MYRKATPIIASKMFINQLFLVKRIEREVG